MRNVIIYFLLFFSLAQPINAQQVDESKKTLTTDNKHFVQIKILDSTTSAPLEGINVRLILSTGNSLILTTDNFGNVFYDKESLKDSLSFIIKSFKYKMVNYTHKITDPRISITVRLKDSIIVLPEIKVIGRISAMRVKGDTTIYERKAFKTMRGDRVLDLIKKLPGIEYNGGKLSANGVSIKEIYINGLAIFGTNVQAALELMKADSIKTIEVYDTYSKKDKVLGDTLKSKDRIIDLKTRKTVTLIKQTLLQTSAGKYLIDKDTVNIKDKYIYTLSGAYNKHEEGNNLTLQLGFGDKSTSLGNPTEKNTKEINGYLIWNKHPKDFKTHFISTTVLTKNEYENSMYSSKEFFSTKQDETFFQIEKSRQFVKSLQLSSNNTFYYRLNKFNTITVNSDIKILNSQKGSALQNETKINDNNTYLSDLSQNNKGAIFTYNNLLEFKHVFKNRGSFLAGVALNFENMLGINSSIDTLSSSFNKIYFEDNGKGWSNNLKVYTKYQEPLTTHTRLIVNYIFIISNNKTTQSSTNIFTNKIDTLNTYDYSFRNTFNSVSTALIFKKNKFELSAGLRLVNLKQTRKESFPIANIERVNYWSLLPDLNFSFTAPTSRFLIKYSESTTEPSITELREFIDTRNSSHIKGGNPHLTQSINRSVLFNWDYFSILSAANLNFKFEATFISNYLTTKTIILTKDSLLNNYNIAAKAGTTLSTLENANGRWSMNSGITYSKKTEFLESSLRVNFDYLYDRIPIFINNDLLRNSTHKLATSCFFLSGFSRFIEISALNTAEIGYSIINKDSYTLQSISDKLNLGTRINFMENFWWSNNIIFQFYNANLPNSYRKEIIMNTSLSCKFGKNNNGVLTLAINDMFNQAKSIIITIEDAYIKKVRDEIFGRSIYLSFSYIF
ncbi:MAG: hypothetical protein CVT93_04240 [Bacteroidetes bacterium HGW-Bacteroidetes-10]|nr:MAG: hypothetical protein CVT93_04240 [Bacteroidetes bacterium HGW-Bacteroidetes-10]